MFAEFFLSNGPYARQCRAWCGLIIYFAHAGYRTWVRWRINNWYKTFYDLVQQSAVDASSGDVSGEGLASRREEIWDCLIQFLFIVGPNVVAHPLFRLIQNSWVLSWRLALVSAYLSRWKVLEGCDVVEGAAQRVSDDVRLFCNGIGGIVMIAIEAVATLVVFCPVLYDLSESVTPWGHGHDDVSKGYLLYWVVVAAAVGTVVTVAIGRRLLYFEIRVQRIEATLRTLLVWLESSPELIIANMTSEDGSVSSSRTSTSIPTVRRESVLRPFAKSTNALWSALISLYAALCGVSLWLSIFNETAMLFPYFLAGPLLFAEDPGRRITLGVLVQLSNAFEKVVTALSAMSESFPELNAFAAVVVRLREFEAAQKSATSGAQGQLLGRATPVVRAEVEFVTNVEQRA